MGPAAAVRVMNHEKSLTVPSNKPRRSSPPLSSLAVSLYCPLLAGPRRKVELELRDNK